MKGFGDRPDREQRNVVFTLLSNHRRRYLLYACNRTNGTVSLSDIAEQVAAWEYDKSVEEINSTERKRVYSSIQQHHVPKLEEAGFLEVDGDELALTDQAENLDIYVELVSEPNISWANYYLWLSVIGACSIAAAAFGLFPPVVSPMLVSVLFAGTVLVSAAIHLFQSRQLKFAASDLPPEIDGD